MLSVWKHFSLCNPLLLGTGGRKGFCPSCFLGAFFSFFPKCVVYLVLRRRCSQFPLIVPIPASSCSHLSWTLAPSPLAPAGAGERPAQPQRCQLRCHARDPAALRTLSRWAQGEVVMKNKTKKRPKKCLWAIAYCSQGTLGIPKLWGSCWNDSILRAQALCSVCLPISVSKMIMSKFTAGFRFQERERKWVLAAREGRSRSSSLLCCCQSRKTLLSAVKLSCPGWTDCKVHLVNVE